MGLLPTLTGTYDVLTVPLLLPTSVVESLLPAQWRHLSPSLLLPTPHDLLSGLKLNTTETQDHHLVLLQLGHQQNTGPGVFKLTFQEAKLEIPFVRHPKASGDQNEKTFLFKLKCLFSNPMIYSGSQFMTGLNSAVASFHPSDSPYSSAADAATIEYEAKNYFTVQAKLDNDAELKQKADEILKLAELPWFGDRTGDTVTQFDFDPPSIGPTAYQVSGTLHLGAFSQDVEPKELEFTSVAFRARNTFKAIESKLGKA
ncbi:unnamed protein product [Sympodiomycopsis kandeliae]